MFTHPVVLLLGVRRFHYGAPSESPEGEPRVPTANRNAGELSEWPGLACNAEGKRCGAPAPSGLSLSGYVLRQAVKLLNLLSWNESSCEILVYGGTRSALPVNQSWYRVRFIPQ